MPNNDNAPEPVLKAGDILFKHCDFSLENVEIAFGQLFGRGMAKIVHAAIVAPGTEVITFDGDGPYVKAPSAGNVFDVYRCMDEEIAKGAAQFAHFTVQQASRVGYRWFGKRGAMMSVWSRRSLRQNRLSTAMEHRIRTHGYAFFCSSHVAFCYQYALEKSQLWMSDAHKEIAKAFKLEHYCYNPAYLHRRICKSRAFRYVGVIRG